MPPAPSFGYGPPPGFPPQYADGLQNADLNKRAGWALGLGITALVTLVLCFPLSLIFGTIALVMGRNANREARVLGVGELGNAKAGWICGLIALILSGLLTLLIVVGLVAGRTSTQTVGWLFS